MYTLAVFFCWIAMMLFQWASTHALNSYKVVMAGLTDERLSFVNDLIVGCCTIKCYC